MHVSLCVCVSFSILGDEQAVSDVHAVAVP